MLRWHLVEWRLTMKLQKTPSTGSSFAYIFFNQSTLIVEYTLHMASLWLIWAFWMIEISPPSIQKNLQIEYLVYHFQDSVVNLVKDIIRSLLLKACSVPKYSYEELDSSIRWIRFGAKNLSDLLIFVNYFQCLKILAIIISFIPPFS